MSTGVVSGPRCGRCGSTVVHVRYEVPDLAVVEDRRVVRVVVDDESISTPVAVECLSCDATEDAPGTGGFARACEVAESTDWPGWDFGW